MRPILQSTLSLGHFINARGNLFLWMATHFFHTGSNICDVGAVLHIFANFIRQQIG